MSTQNPNPNTVPLAPGFRFHPTDEELVIYYLKRKILNRPLRLDAIAEIDLYKFEPWDLPAKSRIRSRDLEWYFFSPLDRKYSNKSRTNRATKEGYWKTTGKDREVKRGDRTVGMKKTLVFHMGRAPSGKRTNWVMHEYRIEGEGVLEEAPATAVSQDLYVVCRIFQKSGSGPQNGAQYGAPFMEEEWEQEVNGGDEAMAAVMQVENNDDLNDEYLQMNDLLPNENPIDQNPSPLAMPNPDATSVPSIQKEKEENKQPIKQEVDEPTNYTNKPADNDNENFTTSEWPHGSLWPLRTRDDPTCPGGADEIVSLSEILNVDEFFDNTTDGTESNLETTQDGDLVRSPLICDYDYVSSEVDEGKTAFYNVNEDDGVSDGRYLDDLMAYFDETEVDIKYDLSASVQNTDECNTECADVPAFMQEDDNVMVRDATPKEEPKEVFMGECSTSAEPSSSDDTNHLKRKTFDRPELSDEYSDKSSIRKRLVSMLGSISAPTGMASDCGSGSSKAIAAANSAGPIRVTAGMIQIRGDLDWPLHKNGMYSFVFSCGTDATDLLTKSAPFEPEMVTKMQDDAASVILRSGFYLFFVSLALLTLSYKLAICIRG
ncbi:NAC domain-containing protein 78 [Rhynchospora pubera]|uniref:NAC domain-containing protein 78 n=1 Tax=Rhynchospora pubera TaxID=906938 RepID=A0AAV8EB32_9POAL|nr:NAC domain-containing protein 78 [Rhynchospora pubera]